MRSFVLLAAFAFVLGAAPAFAAWPHDPAVNLPVCTAASYQDYPSAVTDGAGGVIVTWFDYRSGTNQDSYVQRIDRDGNALWTSNGIAAFSSLSSDIPISIAADGSGGAYIGIELTFSASDHDIYLSHVLANGSVPSGWPRVVTSSGFNDTYPIVASDGTGGVYVAWDHSTGTTSDVYATHFDASGAVVSGWVSTGSLVCSGAWAKTVAEVLADGSGGVIIVWRDSRNDDFDVYAQRLRANGTVVWTANGTKALAAGNGQYARDAIADGSGGVFVVAEDTRAGGSEVDVYMGHVLADGTYPGYLGEAGAAVATGSLVQNGPALALDGAGGVFVAYTQTEDSYERPYVMRLASTGLLSPYWSAGGLRLSSDACNQYVAGVVSDGLGGAYVVFKDFCTGSLALNVARVLPTRATAQGWSYGGLPFSVTGTGLGLGRAGIVDENHDLIVVFKDGRVSDGDIYAQKIDHNGVLGAPAPSIAGVKDVRGDEGGQVRLAWNAGWPDNEVDRLVSSYSVWRQLPVAAARAALRAAGASSDSPPATIETETTSAGTIYWELVGSQTAAYTSGYSYVVPTAGDSVAGSNPRILVKVRAHTSAGAFWDSAPDSGYSVDNLAPSTPVSFAGSYASGAGALLTWSANAEPDLAGYRVYRGSTPGFVPGPANLVASPADPGWFDAGAAPAWYRLSAVDVHGNESGTTLLLPGGTTDAEAASTLALAFAPVAPNPARGPARFTWTQPGAGRVTLAVFDAQGRRVRTLLDETRAAGAWSAAWDGRASNGAPFGSGLYFARLTCGGRTFTQRFAFVR